MRAVRKIRNAIIAGCACAVIAAGCGAATPAPSFTPEVHILWTPDAAPTPASADALTTASPTRSSANLSTTVPTTATPLPASIPVTYTIVDGDTLWDVAVRYGLTIDEMVVANPSIDADRLKLGQVINIPAAGSINAAQIAQVKADVTATAAAGPKGTPGMVAVNADGLRMREGPSANSVVLSKLKALTPVVIIRHSDDQQWMLVALADGNRGWVMARYVDAANSSGSASGVAVAVKAPAGAAISTDSLKGNVAYLSGFSTRARDIFAAGQSLGNRANVFAVVGDSNSASPLYLEPFDAGNYDLGSFDYLSSTIKFFKGSFQFTTVAAVVGIDTIGIMDPAKADAARCLPGEHLLACEYRRKRPAVALILLGTNDTGNWPRVLDFEVHYRRIIEFTISKGIVPVLETKGDDLESTRYGGPSGTINNIIIKLSSEYGVPLLDLHAVVSRLPNGGFGTDGYHYNVPPDAQTANFTGTHMNYGYTIRNLTSLQALDAVRRLVIGN